ncbi:MAG: YqeG family HAD IIIA-type phosphatase [Cyanobacteria bacterium]|nr:YqeG family HAD IIIA-type phosphatase [Cyanobacteriota bacterium]
MSWGKSLQPDLFLNDTILSLTPELLERHQIQGLVLDVDETLVPIKMSQISAEILPWVESVRTVTPQIWLVSNNVSESRINRIAQALDVPYLLGAAKPSRRKIRRAVESMNLPMERVAMVGDRLFTDVLAGNRLGMFTVLVKPMVDPTEIDRKHLIHSLEFRLSRALGAVMPIRD